MSKFNEVFEFEGQEYVKSERANSEVKVGDVVWILKHHPDYEFWSKYYDSCFGKCFKISEVANEAVSLVGMSGLWMCKYFEILEPPPKTNPRPHSELIKQWADDDSLEIEFKGYNSGKWLNSPIPSWSNDYEYRIKPKTVPAWRVLYESHGVFGLSWTHYKTEEEFYNRYDNGEKFIRFILETEKQVEA